MNVLGKLMAGVGAVLLTATAVTLPDMGKVKAPVAVQVNREVYTGNRVQNGTVPAQTLNAPQA
jgi:hypothetical protein